MMSKVVLKKLIAVTVISSASVGYVAYQSVFNNMEGNGEKDDHNAMISNMSMFSTAYISGNSSLSDGDGKARKYNQFNDDISLLGSKGSYGHSRVGKAYRYRHD